jgi:hypothetical protein
MVVMSKEAAAELKRLVAGFPPRRPGFDPGSGQMGFVLDKVVLGQVFSEYFAFPCQSSFHQLLHNHPHLSSWAGTIGQKWPQCKGLSPTPLAIKKTILHKACSSLSFSERHTCNDRFVYDICHPVLTHRSLQGQRKT